MFAPLFAEDKKVAPPQPTQEERISLMQAQRDWLIADRKAHDMAQELDAKAHEIAAKYHCVSWNPDFTCVVEAPKADTPKAEKK